MKHSVIRFFLVAALGFGVSVHAEQVCQADNIAASTPLERFEVNSDGTVYDSQTGLMWLGCLHGSHGTDCSEGEPQAGTWAQALQVAPALNAAGGYAGYSDWRLANIRELSTLAELQCKNPAANLSVFPAMRAVHVWSSSPYHFYTHYSWYVDFSNGAPTYDERIRNKYVLLVRDLNE